MQKIIDLYHNAQAPVQLVFDPVVNGNPNGFSIGFYLTILTILMVWKLDRSK